jgi:hypothetical protein
MDKFRIDSIGVNFNLGPNCVGDVRELASDENLKTFNGEPDSGSIKTDFIKKSNPILKFGESP